ncbi:MAG: hypothetical protein HC831_26365 [Chloroflexia bacterium]|nr:hypothetical protein [Chloroflexia bacterium]
MKFAFLFLLWIYHLLVFSQENDSLVVFSDLKYHSDFEKEAISHYVQNKTDTLNLFLAIDSAMSIETALVYNKIFRTMIQELHDKDIESMKIPKRVRRSFTILHDNHLHKYNEIEFLPSLFEKGNYNCVTSSILYSMVFEELKIPYKIQATKNHVYLVANPGPNSIVVETTNPSIEKKEYLEDYKREYVSHLRSIKLISEKEYKTKSVNEIFEEKINNVWTAEFNNLIGFQYYNLGLVKFSNKEVEESYKLFQKAYFFNSDKQVQLVLYGVLLQLVSTCKYEKVSDIDYIAQLSRYKEINFEFTKKLVLEILEYHLQFTDRLALCDSIYDRFISQITNETNKEEMDFEFNLFMGKHLVKSKAQKKYVERLVNIRQNHREANDLFVGYLEYSLKDVYDYEKQLKAINEYRKSYPYNFVQKVLYEYELIAHLNEAQELLKYNYIEDGDIYLKKFENLAPEPIDTENENLIKSIENAYRALAIYYFYNETRQKAIDAINRGLKYVPGSRYLQTAVY